MKSIHLLAALVAFAERYLGNELVVCIVTEGGELVALGPFI